jgi:hypothetical protein
MHVMRESGVAYDVCRSALSVAGPSPAGVLARSTQRFMATMAAPTPVVTRQWNQVR